MLLDQRLVELGLADSRVRAKALIEASAVTMDGIVARKAAQTVAMGAEVRVTADPNPWLSRGALKLIHTLDMFGLTPRGVALDMGASTGGFTEVLLVRGVDRVFALYVGHGQLHPRIAADPPGLPAWRGSMPATSPPGWCRRWNRSLPMFRFSR